jgi:hypothetical protein
MAFHTEMQMDVQGRWVKSCPLRSKWEGFWVYDFNWKKQVNYHLTVPEP